MSQQSLHPLRRNRARGRGAAQGSDFEIGTRRSQEIDQHRLVAAGAASTGQARGALGAS